ncbi:MAG: hypothetical protein ACLTBF_02710 [Christensenellales bacterium]
MGGSVAALVTEAKIPFGTASWTAASRPYQLLALTFHRLKDYLMMMLGRAGGVARCWKGVRDMIIPEICSMWRMFKALRQPSGEPDPATITGLTLCRK